MIMAKMSFQLKLRFRNQHLCVNELPLFQSATANAFREDLNRLLDHSNRATVATQGSSVERMRGQIKNSILQAGEKHHYPRSRTSITTVKAHAWRL